MTKKIVSILLVLALFLCFFAGSAFAVAGDASGTFEDFRFFYSTSVGPGLGITNFSGTFGFYQVTSGSSSTSSGYMFTIVFILPGTLASQGIVSISDFPFGFFSSSDSGTWSYASVASYSDDGSIISGSSHSLYSPFSFPINFPVPSSTRFIRFSLFKNTSGNAKPLFSNITYSGFSYSSSGGGNYDPSLDQNILEGLIAIGNSLLSFSNGPYSYTDSMGRDSNGNLYWTSSPINLHDLLISVGESSTFSSNFLAGLSNNFGSFYEYHSISDPSSGSVAVVRNLPAYVNALGMELTDGINKLQRDNLLLYQQGENIEDALYTDKTENQPWSVAQWLKDIYTSITSFFSSFWSPAETDLKSAAEDGMQAAADNGNAASGSQVDEVNSAADAFKSFGSTGNIGSGDVMDIFSDGASYDFFSQTTKDNLAYHPPAGSQRMLRSSSAPPQSDQIEEEYVDELDDKLSYWREVLGLP